ncbi:MAG: FtsX-like permease family protein [Promicromonosporaceae bacterium]|nr:FtsX-like permease family protein [Promicromonosporaceae bacterium]
MLRLTLAQMRRSASRLAAAGVAIAIGAAFVAATLLAGDVITRATYDSIAARYAEADLVVAPPLHSTFSPNDLLTVADTQGVADSVGLTSVFLALSGEGRTVWQGALPLTSLTFMPLELSEGAWPQGASQIALPADTAERLNVSVGDTIGVDSWAIDTAESLRDELTVVGIVGDPLGAYTQTGGRAVMAADALTERAAAEGGRVAYTEILLMLADDARAADVRATLTTLLPEGTQVLTPHEHAAVVAATITDGQNVVFYVFVLSFAAIALMVAGLVISNTFQVLVAQRTKTLALLRAVGAGKRQVAFSVVLEATLLGVISSLIGVAVGAGLGQLALALASGGSGVAASLPTYIALTWQVVAIPVIAGLVVTLMAALVPARAATRVAPLAALRPEAAPTIEKGSAGRVRLVVSVLLMLAGFAALAGGAWLGTAQGDSRANAAMGLLAGITGGFLSFVGVALSGVFWMPLVIRLAGRLAGLTGPTARLAAANMQRNPRRSAATATALLIGVTLVTMMSTGAASARASMDAAFDSFYPIDMAIEAGTNEALPAEVMASIMGTAGVGNMAQVTNVIATIDVSARDYLTMTVAAVDPTAARAALNDTALVDGLTAGVIAFPSSVAAGWEVSSGDAITLRGPTGEVELTALVTGGQGLWTPIVTPDDLAAVGFSAAPNTLWLSLDSLSAIGRLHDVIADSNLPLASQGSALERAEYETVINTALGVVVGLLAVAVVIALIGVANTLSLSVLERRRESATLRAIGVTRGQLRGMLAVEGALIAGVGAVTGISLGLVYGWAGSLAALGVMGEVALSVPWRDVALVAMIALGAGLVASVAPGRSAVRPSPVAALGTE